MQYDALLFDVDGVLLERTSDDRAAFERAVRAAFADHGVDDPDPEHVADLVYGVTPEYLRGVCTRYDLDEAAFWRSRDEHCSRVQRDAIAAGEKGLYPDVAALHDLPDSIGAVSTNQQATLAFAFERLDVPEFSVVRGRPPTVESLRLKKPNPHYLEEALASLGVGAPTDRALYVGDSAHDVVAAHAAGLDAAFLRRDHNADVSLSAEPAYELAGLEELGPAVGATGAPR